MTETEYINATNLTKLKLMNSIVLDCTPRCPQEEFAYRSIAIHLRDQIERLERAVMVLP